MYNYIIIGGGIVGLSTAYSIKRTNIDASVLILEKESGPAFHQTGETAESYIRGFTTSREA